MNAEPIVGRLLARAKRAAALSVLLALGGSKAYAQFCPGCVQNTAAPQNATFNLTQGATIQGVLTVGTLNLTTLAVSGNVTGANLIGAGSGITALNASALASGTVPAARLTGSYTGVTGLGTVTAGTWQGAVLAPAYGGTGANLSISGTAGGMPYFSGSGVQGVITSPSGPRVLMSAGSGATPVWTSSPALTGQNFSAIPLTALVSGTLPHSIQVDTNSIANTNGAGVIGDIPGGAAYLTIPLPIANLAGGTLPTSNAASSITVTGVTPGVFGGPSTLAQVNVHSDGRIYSIAQFNLVVPSTAIAPGPLPAGVTIAAAQISSGPLANNVIASSLNVTGLIPGTYGGAAQTLTLVARGDGRLSSVSAQSIAIPPTQLTAGTLPSNVLVPAANVQNGLLGSGVQASSLAANGVTPGTYGGSGTVPQVTIGADGRVTSATQFTIPALSTYVAFSNIDNGWSHAQTSFSSWTILSDLYANTFSSLGGIFGPGQGITNLNPGNFDAGPLNLNVTVSTSQLLGYVDARSNTVSTFTVTGPDGLLVTGAFLVQDPNDSIWALHYSADDGYVFMGKPVVINAGADVNGLINTPDGLRVGIGNLATYYQGFSSTEAVTIFGTHAIQNGTNYVTFYNGGPDGGTALEWYNDPSGPNPNNHSTASMLFSSASFRSAIEGPQNYLSWLELGTIYNTNTDTWDSQLGGMTVTISAGSNFYTRFISTFTQTGDLMVPGGVYSNGVLLTPGGVSTGVVTTASLTGNGNSGSPLAVSASSVPFLNSSGLIYNAQIDKSSMTAQGNVFNVANRLVKLDGSGALPAISGANLTNLPNSTKFGFLTGNNGTLGVGTFQFGYTNAAVSISSISVIITVSGSGGTTGTHWSCCFGGSCVSVTSSASAAAGSSYTANGAVAVSAGGQIVLEMESTDESVTPTANVTCGYQ